MRFCRRRRNPKQTAHRPGRFLFRVFYVPKEGDILWGKSPLAGSLTGILLYKELSCKSKGDLKMSSLWQTVSENVVFVLEFLALIVVMFLIAYVIEKAVKKKNSDTERVLATRKIVVIGVFSAIAAILMVLEFPVPFAPSFYGLDFSELPALIGAFAYGPVAGVMIEFCKILIKLVLKPSSTAFVGELANFSISCMLVLPASVIYLFKKSRKQAILGTVVGTLIMTAFGSCFNAIYLLPKFSELYGIPLDAIIGMGTAINPAIHSISGLVLMCVVPLNLLKGGLVSLITILVYKKLSPILKAAHKQ